MSWDDFSSPGWADRDGDGHISFDEGMEEDFSYRSFLRADRGGGYSDDDFDDGEYYFNSAGGFGRSGSVRKSADRETSGAEKTKSLSAAFLLFHEKHISSLWDDRWELASLLLRITYLASLVLLCYHQFGEAGGFPEFIEIMVYILVISIFGAIGFFAFFVWQSVCKEKDPYPDYFDNLAEKPETLYPRPVSIKLWLLFFVISFIALRIGAHPENIQKTFMLTDSAAVAFSVAGLLTPVFLVLIYKAFTTVKLIGVKKELMKDLEKKKIPAIINPLKALLTVIFAAMLILSTVAVSKNKEKTDLAAESIYQDMKDSFYAENYEEMYEKMDELKRINRENYKDTKAFRLFCEAKEAFERGDVDESNDLIWAVLKTSHRDLPCIYYGYFERKAQYEIWQKELEESRIAAKNRPQKEEEKPKKATVFGGGGSSGKSKKSSDPYHASDFSYVEDFYDEYYDDFFDIDDAEEYYMDHYND